jgi:hypothetical protein
MLNREMLSILKKPLKSQAPKTKFQINPNDPNSKFQTNGLSAVAPHLHNLLA